MNSSRSHDKRRNVSGVCLLARRLLGLYKNFQILSMIFNTYLVSCLFKNMAVFWDIVACSLLVVDRRFRCAYCHSPDD
jgi:hypothetical protein